MVYIAKEAWPEKKDFLKESVDKHDDAESYTLTSPRYKC